MLSQSNPAPTIAVRDIQIAKQFYEKKLGLSPFSEGNENVQLYKCGNGIVEIYKSEFAGTNKATAITWEVADIESEVKALNSKGIEFEHYQIPETKLEGDIHVMKDMKAAWFKDPDGNILCMHQ